MIRNSRKPINFAHHKHLHPPSDPVRLVLRLTPHSVNWLNFWLNWKKTKPILEKKERKKDDCPQNIGNPHFSLEYRHELQYYNITLFKISLFFFESSGTLDVLICQVFLISFFLCVCNLQFLQMKQIVSHIIRNQPQSQPSSNSGYNIQNKSFKAICEDLYVQTHKLWSHVIRSNKCKDRA